MKEVFTRWYQRYLSEEEAVLLLVLLAAAFVVMLAFGGILAPVFVAVILAYLMQGVANLLRNRGLPAELSVAVSTGLFLGGFLAVLFEFVVVAVIEPGDASQDRQNKADRNGGDAELGPLERHLLAKEEDQDERDRRQQRNQPGVLEEPVGVVGDGGDFGDRVCGE